MSAYGRLVVVCLIASLGCEQNYQVTPHFATVPAQQGSVTPYLTKGPSENIYLSWQEPVDSTHTILRFSRLDNDGWSEPISITEGKNWFVNWADYPIIAKGTDGLMASSFLMKSADEYFDYDIYLAVSNDGGNQWGSPFMLNNDGIHAEHGFVSMQSIPNQGIQIAWLDGRNTKTIDSATMARGPMTLRTALLNDHGIVQDSVLDLRVCDCCQTDLALAQDGPIVVYRDRSEQEIRDISGFRYTQGRWETLDLPKDHWEINGCPVNGPRIDASEKKVVLTWFTAAQNQPKVLWTTSDDGGKSFSPTVRIDKGNPLGRVDATLLPDQSSVVSWMEHGTEGASIMVQHLNKQGDEITQYVLAGSGSERSSGFPQIISRGYEVIWAWTDTETQEIKSAVMQFSPAHE